VEEDILAIRPEDEAEPLAGVVPLDLGLKRAFATLFAVGKHDRYLSTIEGHDPTRCRVAIAEHDTG
jgi:hypothetical protein